ncbi:MAG: triacylglycerol lipase [Deltaproteobacteria bacterium]|nr:triacylglycerol lipase [Deltaproteobacteria bacterium]
MTQPESHVVLLVPGFFGFSNLGPIAYFGHVKEALAERLAGRLARVEVDTIATHPTGALATRVERLTERVAEARAAHGDGVRVHLVGHSSGGLDARLFVTEGGGRDGLVGSVRSVLTVATPHRGTPLATWFREYNGQALMKLVSLLAIRVTRVGPLKVGMARQIARLLGAGYDAAAKNLDMIDQLVDELLDDFSPERREALRAFFGEVGRDQRLLGQLAPDTIPTVVAPDGVAPPWVRVGSIVTRARRPWLGAMADLGFDATAQAMHLVFRWLQARTGAVRGPAPMPEASWTAALKAAYGEVPGPADNDGIVPTRSQLWGAPVGAVWADHLDVLGHFAGGGERPPHFDWLPSGSGFGAKGFARAWDAAADFVVGAAA